MSDRSRSSLSDVLSDLAELPDISAVTRSHAPATGPGREVKDLPDHLALGRADVGRPLYSKFSATRALDVGAGLFAGVRQSVSPRRDYVWCTWLADVLRAAGVSVVELPGWKRRGRPRSVGTFNPHGLLWHHDASAKGPSPELARFIALVGRPAEGIPAPLAQLWVCMGCDGRHPVGTWHVLAAGRANHGGEGDGWGKIGRDLANSAAMGVETDNTTGEPTPPLMLASLVVGSAAILRHLRSDPRQWLCAHREYAPGRKFDPDDIDMDKARRLVVRTMADQAAGRAPGGGRHKGDKPAGKGDKPAGKGDKPAPPVLRPLLPFPGSEHFVIGRKCSHGYVQNVKTWLGAVDPEGGFRHPGPVYTEHTQAMLRAFQRSRTDLASDADGMPGPLTWRELQQAARAAAGEGAEP